MANWGLVEGSGEGQVAMAVGSAEEAAARGFHKHTAESFLVFLCPGVWLGQQSLFCVLLSSSRMQGRARAFFVSAQ